MPNDVIIISDGSATIDGSVLAAAGTDASIKLLVEDGDINIGPDGELAAGESRPLVCVQYLV